LTWWYILYLNKQNIEKNLFVIWVRNSVIFPYIRIILIFSTNLTIKSYCCPSNDYCHKSHYKRFKYRFKNFSPSYFLIKITLHQLLCSYISKVSSSNFLQAVKDRFNLNTKTVLWHSIFSTIWHISLLESQSWIFRT